MVVTDAIDDDSCRLVRAGQSETLEPLGEIGLVKPGIGRHTRVPRDIGADATGMHAAHLDRQAFGPHLHPQGFRVSTDGKLGCIVGAGQWPGDHAVHA